MVVMLLVVVSIWLVLLVLVVWMVMFRLLWVIDLIVCIVCDSGWVIVCEIIRVSVMVMSDSSIM